MRKDLYKRGLQIGPFNFSSEDYYAGYVDLCVVGINLQRYQANMGF